ncbi:MAG: DUF3604 domain-containing protein [Novosphingobium sp.]
MSKFQVLGVAALALVAAGLWPVEEHATQFGPAAARAAPAPAPALTGNPTRLLWGDTHLHTDFSMDAATFGVKLSPDDAYRFAMGEEVTASNGMKAKLAVPLDFLMVSDHSDNLGSILELEAKNPKLMANPVLAGWLQILGLPDRKDRLALEGRQTEQTNPPELDDDAMRATYWARTIAAAEAHNQPGKFTAMIGFEWTAQDKGRNLHRVVMFRDGARRTSTIIPLSANRTDDPQDLWKWLGQYEQSTGGQVLAIAHNGNISNGAMFPLDQTEFGKPMTADYVRQRARWEPAYETTQIKGDGETHPFLSVDDEFANFERWDKADFAGVPKTKDMLPGEYTRSALKRGLELERRFGVNPYKFGLIGSTDSHTGMSTADDDNFWGKHSAQMEQSPTRWKDPVGGRDEVTIPGWMMAASGYAAVWTRDNTREEVWDAFKRREVYATTGPRITLRFFGGWNFRKADATKGDIAPAGYAGGVPMGGELNKAKGKAPRFLVQAMKDPRGATLDRVQIVKGWIDADGQTHEKVYDVAWSHPETRRPGKDGKLPLIKGNVDVANASYDNSVGAPFLTAMWSDPAFNARQHAFYYVRVLQIPTPRWTAYDAKQWKVSMPDYVPMVIQERAYSSPIWYNP